MVLNPEITIPFLTVGLTQTISKESQEKTSGSQKRNGNRISVPIANADSTMIQKANTVYVQFI